MNKIQVLDCTLRDGGYCNHWSFGYQNIKKIIAGLDCANIDIIECGFLTDKEKYDTKRSKFNKLEQIIPLLPKQREDKIFVTMMNDGEFDLNNLPDYDGLSIEGIRVAFHKNNIERALEQCRIIKAKGYKVFMQAMVSLNYRDEEFIELLHKANEIGVYAFYIVDSFGMMKENDLMRLFYIIEHNLQKNIWIGFHSHNNLQLAYSNAQCLVKMSTNRNLIIDTSVYGMGRGAGNLNTELFVDFLNDSLGMNYKLKPLLSIIDEILNDFYEKSYWGYSLPNYLSAVHNAHPNYARYLDERKTLTVEGMNEIFESMDEIKKYSFDRKYIEKLYYEYMERGKIKKNCECELEKIFKGRKVLLIAPGKSSTEEEKIVREYLLNNKDLITISINFIYPYIDTTYVFLSNLRRYREIPANYLEKCIATSNLSIEDVHFQTDYQELLNNEEPVCDNAGLMAIKFLMVYGALEVFLVGFDGYTHDYKENYGNNELAFVSNDRILDKMNIGIKKVIKEYSESINLKFLTSSKYIDKE